MGSFLLTETVDRRPEIGLDSYDRFFPNQDTVPNGGFGNLIALPLQKKPREHGNSIFVDENFIPYNDQWAFLSSVERMKASAIEMLVEDAARRGRIIGVRMVLSEDDDEPWTAPPSRIRPELPLSEPLPEEVIVVLGNQVYVEKVGLASLPSGFKSSYTTYWGYPFVSRMPLSFIKSTGFPAKNRPMKITLFMKQQFRKHD